MRMLLPWRHTVDDAGGSVVGLELRLKHETSWPVPPRDARDPAGRRDQPPPVTLVAQQRGEAGPRIEAREAEPVDRAVAADQRGRVRVADERVLLDPLRHEAPQRTISSARSGGQPRATSSATWCQSTRPAYSAASAHGMPSCRSWSLRHSL